MKPRFFWWLTDVAEQYTTRARGRRFWRLTTAIADLDDLTFSCMPWPVVLGLPSASSSIVLACGEEKGITGCIGKN